GRDILPGGSGSSPQSLTEVNGRVFFSATDGSSGRELWGSDGTAATTHLVLDLYPGSSSSFPPLLTSTGVKLLFAGDESLVSLGAYGLEPWTSDGTAAGTSRLANLHADGGTGDAFSSISVSTVTPELTDVNGTLFFPAYDGVNLGRLWTSDGTDAGTF